LQQSFKGWDAALKNKLELDFLFPYARLTCNRSSKSRAASFFISDAFVAKRLIVLEPKVGMARNLVVTENINSQ